MVGRIIGIILSLVMIIGGLSGKLVLRGTNSGTALVVVGVIFLIIEVVRIVKDAKTKNEGGEDY